MKRFPQFGLGVAAIGAVLLFTGAAPAIDESATMYQAAATLNQPPADESMACAPRDQLVGELGKQFRESQKAIGTLGDKAIMEIFVSDAGTWTILATDTTGTSCIIAAGKSWDEANPATMVGQEV